MYKYWGTTWQSTVINSVLLNIKPSELGSEKNTQNCGALGFKLEAPVEQHKSVRKD